MSTFDKLNVSDDNCRTAIEAKKEEDTLPQPDAARLSEGEVAHQVLRAIRQIVHRISEHSKQLSTEYGLTVPQLMCLKAVGELQQGLEEITVANVSKRVQLSPATVSRIIERMVRVGWLERERAEKDRRKVSLSLTAVGRARFESLPIPLQERFVARLHALPPEERLVLLSSLQRLSALMEAETIDAAPILHQGDAWSEG